MGGAGSFASCYGHNCDGSTTVYGRNAGEGELVNADTWESSPQTGNSIPYLREETIFFEVPQLEDRVPYLVLPLVSAEQNVTSTGGNETVGSGNLAEISGITAGHFAVHNDTCADYFVRVVAFFAPVGAAVPSPAPSVGASASDGGTGTPQAANPYAMMQRVGPK